jgi:alcohol dehydrogenase (cytochrome c)
MSDLWEFPDGPRGYLKAIDPLTGKAKWENPSDIPRYSGVLSTAGGIVFSGQLTGEFEAFDADTGKKLWQFRTGSGIEGQPVTWQQDGVQYVAVTSGIGGSYLIFTGDSAAGFGSGRRIALGVCAGSAVTDAKRGRRVAAASLSLWQCR